uniref:Uncharacterized protein n=1 Tax=Nymphaea colorata TaxID=210225 RepID=A0A5K0Y6I7_9MAGN
MLYIKKYLYVKESDLPSNLLYRAKIDNNWLTATPIFIMHNQKETRIKPSALWGSVGVLMQTLWTRQRVFV